MQAPQNFQEQKQAARKDNAGNRAAWNALFMRPDTVSAAVAAHYGVSKAQLLDRDAAGKAWMGCWCTPESQPCRLSQQSAAITSSPATLPIRCSSCSKSHQLPLSSPKSCAEISATVNI